jgi:hypothetical protein
LGSVTSARLGVEHADGDLGPFRPLDLRHRGFGVDAGDRFAPDRDDRVARGYPGLGGGRAGEDRDHLEALLRGHDREPDAGEAAFDLLVEGGQAFGREVVGEAVVVAAAQLAHHALERGVLELGVADRAVVVVLDQFRRFGGQPGGLGDEPFAQEVRQLGRVAAEPEADAERDDKGHGERHGAACSHADLRP